jgi:hypothetical protein
VVVVVVVGVFVCVYIFVVLEIEHRTSSMLGKRPAKELHTQAQGASFKVTYTSTLCIRSNA